jgi:NAD(P)-dependent dehydrogenase (short-subunit alcohol dehydrogenase family)
MLLRHWRWMGVGKRNFKVGVAEVPTRAILLIGGSGGIGRALIQSDLFCSNRVCVPTYFSNRPTNDDLPWHFYDSIDVSNAELMFEKLSNEFEIDMIIDASGAFFASTLKDASLETISKVAWTNFLAPMTLAKMALQFLAPSGKVVFLSSVTTQLSLYGSSVYAASKSGLEKLISLLGSEYANNGKAICGIRLGYMDYGMTYRINLALREEIRTSLPNNEFSKIAVLSDLLLDILRSDYKSVTGTIFDLSL